MYADNYKTLFKEMKDLNKLKEILYSWIGRRNSLKMAINLKVMYRVDAINIKIPTFSAEIEQLILIFTWGNEESK